MGAWISRALTGGAVMFVVGWILVLISERAGGSIGVSDVLWHIGGIFVYVAVPTVLVTGLVAMVVSMLRRR